MIYSGSDSGSGYVKKFRIRFRIRIHNTGSNQLRNGKMRFCIIEYGTIPTLLRCHLFWSLPLLWMERLDLETKKSPHSGHSCLIPATKEPCFQFFFINNSRKFHCSGWRWINSIEHECWGSGSGSGCFFGLQYQDPDPDPLARGTDPYHSRLK